MSAGSREVIASTVFVPTAFAAAITVAYMRNCRGVVDAAAPDNTAVGNYTIMIPRVLDPLRTSVTKRAWTAAGVARLVAVVLTPNTPAGWTTAEIYTSDQANPNALVEDAAFVEVTFAQLPL